MINATLSQRRVSPKALKPVSIQFRRACCIWHHYHISLEPLHWMPTTWPCGARYLRPRPAGKITLNVKLIQVPTAHIDYVVFHELCHLNTPSHSQRFYELLDRILPDWRERRQRIARPQKLRLVAQDGRPRTSRHTQGEQPNNR